MSGKNPSTAVRRARTTDYKRIIVVKTRPAFDRSLPEVHIHHRWVVRFLFGSRCKWSFSHRGQYRDPPDDTNNYPTAGGIDMVRNLDVIIDMIHEVRGYPCRHPK